MKNGKLGAVSVVAALVSLAAGSAWALSDSALFTIDELWFDGATVIYVEPTTPLTNNASNNPAGCASTGRYVANSTTEETRQRIYQTLLAAMLAGKKVSLRVSESTCSSSYPVFSGVRLDRDDQ